jgi:branched-chain amino acid transport system ATP-binding protein
VFDGRPLDGLIAHERTHLGLARSFQLPKPFHTLDLVDNIRVPLIYTVNARHGQPITVDRAIEARCTNLLRRGRARRQGAAAAA